jgi:hypothetical protein
MMKSTLLFSIGIFATIQLSAKSKDVYYSDSNVSSNKISLSPYYGFNFDESFDTDFGYVYMDQGSFYGISMDFQPSDNIEFELTWQKQVAFTTANVDYYSGYNKLIQFTETGDMAIDYFMVGMNGLKSPSDLITLYGGASAGIVVFTPRVSNFDAAVKFAVALKGGVRINLNDHLAIRLQPQLYLPIQSLGADVFISNGGSSVGVSGYSTITQFGGCGGLTVSF